MADHFFDTSAISKHYQRELGTAFVDGLLLNPGQRHYITRLAVVELHSALAKKVRVGQLNPADFQLLTRQFRADVSRKKFGVLRLQVSHFELAERLIRRLGPTQNLRTLDSLQLAVALSLNEPANPIVFVSSDQVLCAVAKAEGLAVLNPEQP
jgi:uncharacterized protein